MLDIDKSSSDRKKIYIASCRTDLTSFTDSYSGRIIKNNNNIDIDAVYAALQKAAIKDNLFTEHLFDEKSYFIDKEEESYKLNNATMGDYEVKKYTLENNNDASYRYSIYVFKNNEYYGYVKSGYRDTDSSIGARILENELDFAIKNLKLGGTSSYQLKDVLNIE